MDAGPLAGEGLAGGQGADWRPGRRVHTGPARPAELIFYRRPDTAGARYSDYHRVPVADPDMMKRALGRALGVLSVIVEQRRVYLYRNAGSHLDVVRRMGRFIEIEVMVVRGPRQARTLLEKLLRDLAIDQDQPLPGSYCDLLPGRRAART